MIFRSIVYLVLLIPFSSMGCYNVLPPDDLSQFANSMLGSFSSAEQANTDSTFFDIRLEVVPIWVDRDDGPWLYVEQAAAESLDKPYRQRVYNLSVTDSFLVSEIYSIKDPLRFAGRWRSNNPLSRLNPDSLSLREGCAVYMTRIGIKEFVGKTRHGSCTSVLRGASYATSEVEIDESTLRSWDRGYAKNHTQVWGSENGPYVFKRVERTE